MTCVHNHILITASTRRSAPYLFCSKCGDIRETGAHGHIIPTIQSVGPLDSEKGECLSADQGLIAMAANAISDPLEMVAPGVAYIKADAAQALLDRARELGGGD